MDIIELATQLAEELQKTDTYKNLDAARKLNDMDEELQKQIGDFNLARIAANNLINAGEQDEAKLEEASANMNKLYDAIMQNESMIGYKGARGDMDTMMNHVNAILNAAIEGGDPRAVQAPVSCGGNCASCGSQH